jgi:hypothetical protein
VIERIRNIPGSWRLRLVIALAALAGFIYVYQFEPFPYPWTDAFINVAIIAAASWCAGISARVLVQFRPGEPPRSVWASFALGLSAWALAEGVWFLIFWVYGDVPEISWADLFWLMGFVFLGAAFVFQFRLIYGKQPRRELGWMVGVVGAILLLSGLVTMMFYQSGQQAEGSWVETYLSVFYSFADLALALAAIQLARIFGRGMWGRAWWGLLVLTVADGLYSWLEFTGVYAVSAESGNLFSMAADGLYLAAYLLLALALYAQLLLTRFGPNLRPAPPDSRQPSSEAF